MDTARYVVALLWLVLSPSIALWFFIHPFAGFWRRLGPKAAYLATSVPLVLTGAALLLARHSLLSVEYGTQPLLWPLALLCYGTALFIERKCRKQITVRTIVGVPELAADQSRRRLLTEGIYARVRHPRYVAIFLALLTAAFFSNYLALYVLVPIYAGALYLVSLLEEKELLAVFGEEYARYLERTPRFIPRRARAAPQGDAT